MRSEQISSTDRRALSQRHGQANREQEFIKDAIKDICIATVGDVPSLRLARASSGPGLDQDTRIKLTLDKPAALDGKSEN